MKRAKNVKNLKANNKQLCLVKKVYNIFNKIDDEDVYFLAFSNFLYDLHQQKYVQWLNSQRSS